MVTVVKRMSHHGSLSLYFVKNALAMNLEKATNHFFQDSDNQVCKEKVSFAYILHHQGQYPRLHEYFLSMQSSSFKSF